MTYGWFNKNNSTVIKISRWQLTLIFTECKRPYIAHANQLFQSLNKIEHGLLNIEDAVVSAKTGASTENAERIVKELHDRYVDNAFIIKVMRRGLNE